jgi:hypothetical protein
MKLSDFKKELEKKLVEIASLKSFQTLALIDLKTRRLESLT